MLRFFFVSLAIMQVTVASVFAQSGVIAGDNSEIPSSQPSTPFDLPSVASGSEAVRDDAPPEPFYNVLASPEEPRDGAYVKVKSSSDEIGLMIYGRIAIDSVTSNGRLLAPYGYIFLGPDTPESQWTNVISARQSTLGFLFSGPDLGDFKTLARFETYFLSSVTDANVYGLAQYFMYAKAFNEDWAFTGGLTSALVNPRAPSVLNPSSGSDFGNLGFMRPQLRAEHFLQFGDSIFVTPQFALSSPVGTDFFQMAAAGPDGIQLGEETGWPNAESRLAVGIGEKEDGSRFHPLEFGVSGAVGELRYFKSDLVNPAERFTTLVWMYGVDFRWQITPKLAFTAEGFYGNALGSYAAGIKQTFNRETGQGVRTRGGFTELEYKVTQKWITHGGFMIDDPVDSDVATDNRTRQQNAYGNIMYVHNRYLSVGFEVAHLWADFQGDNYEDNEAWVFHNKIIFTF
ncbi:MAG: hypothetical protein JNL58_20475 [Planctomyces sp.]|nr:hypothetical protein [Planctomyces sp.]